MDSLVPKIGAGVVIIQNGRTLLAKRKGNHGTGMWGSMGGHVEFGETPREAVIREAKEELGVEIGKVEFAMCMNMIKGEKHYLDVSFTAEIVSGEPTIQEPDKIESLGWYLLDNLPSPLFPPVAAVLEAKKTEKRYFEVKEE